MSGFSGRHPYFQEFGFRAPYDRITWAVRLLISATIIGFVAQLVLNIPLGSPQGIGLTAPGGVAVDWFAFDQALFVKGCFWMPVTYIFLHGGLWHLFINMVMFYFVGPDVERTLGSRPFIFFYLLCGLVGVFLTFAELIFYKSGFRPPVVGASGSVMGVLVAFAMVYPDREFFLFPLPWPITARVMVWIAIFLNIISLTGESNTSVATHLGGMATAYVYMKLRPAWLRRVLRRRIAKEQARKQKLDNDIGKAVDNIFKMEDFEDKKR